MHSTDRAGHSTSSQASNNEYEKAEIYEKEQEGPTNEFLSGEVAAIPPATVSGYHPTDAQKRLDRRINLKFDVVITCLLGWGFMMCGIDKTNIGNAATTSFIQDANLDPNDIGNVTSLFAVTFVVLQPFSVYLGRYIGPKWWIGTLTLAFGSLTMAHAAINNRATLIALRLLLGAAEAGFYPSSMFYLSTFFPRYMLATRVGAVSALFVFGSAFSSLVAYGIFNAQDTFKLHGWQVLFLCEGGFTVFLAAVILSLLPKNAGSAWMLNAEERAHASARLQADLGNNAEIDRHGNIIIARHTSWADVKAALTDWPKLIIMLGNMFTVIPVSAFGIFLPLAVQGMGYPGIRANLMAVPPFAIGTVGIMVAVYFSDRTHQRSIIATIGCLIAMVGLIVVVTSDNPKLRYAFINICMSGVFATGPLGLAWLISNTPQPGKRAMIIGLNGWTNLASVISGQLFQARYKPGYHYPLTVVMVLLSITVVIYPSMRVYYMFINHRRAAAVAKMTPEQLEAEKLKKGDASLLFKYGY